MDSAEFSTFLYMTDAIFRAPEQWRLYVDTVRSLRERSSIFLEVLRALEDELSKHSFVRKRTRHTRLRLAADALLRLDEPYKDAGRALDSALQSSS